LADHVHVSDKRWDIKLYGPPNKALGDILMGDRVAAIVGDYTKKVAATYSTMMGSRSQSGNLASTIRAGISPNDGYKGDRWIGEVTVGSSQFPYGASDEYGRKKQAPYRGSADLENSLRMVLRERP
jgi:hypothetical protein